VCGEKIDEFREVFLARKKCHDTRRFSALSGGELLDCQALAFFSMVSFVNFVRTDACSFSGIRFLKY